MSDEQTDNDYCYDSTKEDFTGYFELAAELEAVRTKFLAQPWVEDLLAKRDEDNRNGVPMDKRFFTVPKAQYILARELFTSSASLDDEVKIHRYTLIPGDN